MTAPRQAGPDRAPGADDRSITIEVGGVVLTEEAAGEEKARSVSVDVAPASRFFDGHFPGNPLLPAAALLTLVAEASRLVRPEAPLGGFDAVRFSAPVGPGCSARLTFRERADAPGTLFELATADEVLVSGRLRRGASEG